ncbi:tetratricopeptide repeat-containing sulfotransferase family protein [Arenimonas sp.]|uniref:tetratricopeptide repeat-containing sulfotransferase family protein n=1 Tax=Arenimonas sp. TaxID=1872635 RepID=UPI002E353B19|nr:sulfotransferase [Arenimonas sp.]HEX4853309.1 sulfotransferase [Arenimonas sp.]
MQETGTQGAGTAPGSAVAQGFTLLQQGKLAEATQHCRALVLAHPADPQVMMLACEVRLANGDLAGASEAADAALAGMPGNAAVMLKKAHVLVLQRERAEARQLASAAAALAPGDGRSQWAAGKIFANCGDAAAACPYYEAAIAAGMTHWALNFDLASAQFFAGQFDAADRNLARVLAHVPGHGQAMYLRSVLRRQTRNDNHVADLQARLQGKLASPADAAAGLYALAKEFEDLGEDAASFKALSDGAALKRRALNYDAAAERASIDGLRSLYTAEVMARPTPGHEEEGAIFIVGMPRTGTTLAERMLASQGEVGSAGELLDFGQLLALAAQEAQAAQPHLSVAEASLGIDFAALGRRYMHAARQAAPGKRYFIDKMPINFMYCGILRKALPKARIIHLVRDPMDTCYAVFKTLFYQAYPFSYDQAELAAYYATYRRLMQHWQAVMPGAILDVRYEDLVTDTEAQARRMLDFCGLAWNPAVLDPSAHPGAIVSASAAQVREPVHAGSVGKWRRHEAGLKPLRDRLAAEGFLAS